MRLLTIYVLIITLVLSGCSNAKSSDEPPARVEQVTAAQAVQAQPAAPIKEKDLALDELSWEKFARMQAQRTIAMAPIDEEQNRLFRSICSKAGVTESDMATCRIDVAKSRDFPFGKVSVPIQSGK